jgi:hypothetical protein
MPLQAVGFFRESRYGSLNGPSIYPACTRKDWPDFELAAEYLRGGSTVVASGVMVDDMLEPRNKRVAPLAIVTDGVWVWPAELAYYVKTYRCELPEAFVDHMRRSGWRPRLLDSDDLIRIGHELRANGPQ